MTSYKLFPHSEPLGAILGEIQGLFNRITPFDIKRDMVAILFLELGQNYYQTSFSSHIYFCVNLMKQAGIFLDLEQLYDLQTIGSGGHFVFQKEAKIL